MTARDAYIKARLSLSDDDGKLRFEPMSVQAGDREISLPVFFVM